MIDEISIKVSKSPNTIAYAAQQALKAELYQYRWWMFHPVLCEPKSIIQMATAFYRRKRIGVSIFWNYDELDDYRNSEYGTQLGCFIKPDFRRQGLGQALVDRMNIKNARVGIGAPGSDQFWSKVRGDKLEWFNHG